MALSVAGIVVVVVFYVLIVLVGIIAAWRVKVKSGPKDYESSMVADRDMGKLLGFFTMSATFVGGGYINGTAEGIADPYIGLAWTLAPFSIFTGVIIAGLIFAPPMRKMEYLTVLDPLQDRYGDVMTCFLCLAQCFAELLWGASILAALGTTLSVIIDLDINWAIIVSAAVALVYTAFGQMVAVAYTDILQLIFMFVGLVLCVPFAMTNKHVTSITSTIDQWKGHVDRRIAAAWTDFFIVQVCGSIPWNTFFQRVLSSRTVTGAKVMSCAGAVSALVLAVPPILIGAVGVSADWNATELGYSPIERGEAGKILPLVLNYLTPEPVAIIGLAAIVAAVMSSLDSIILSASSMFTHNAYRMTIRTQASNLETTIVQRVSMLLCAIISATLAIFVKSVYYLFFLSADLVFVIMFPQLVCALFIKHVNGYGSFFGYLLAFTMRIGGGDVLLGLEPFIYFPFFDYDRNEQLFPFKTFSMLMSMTTIILISWIAWFLFSKGIIPAKFDVAGCLKEDEKVLKEEVKVPKPLPPLPMEPDPKSDQNSAPSNGVPNSQNGHTPHNGALQFSTNNANGYGSSKGINEQVTKF